jgi:UDP:flavonoid glycosyltransferase YjiC (YdhE family)
VDADKADGVEFVGFTPLVELLRDVDVVLTHGGAGTVLGTLAEGIPMVVVPQGADQPIHAERVAAAGAGIAIPQGDAAPEAVAETVRKVLAAPTYRGLAEKIAGYDSPADVAEQLTAAISR